MFYGRRCIVDRIQKDYFSRNLVDKRTYSYPTCNNYRVTRSRSETFTEIDTYSYKKTNSSIFKLFYIRPLCCQAQLQPTKISATLSQGLLEIFDIFISGRDNRIRTTSRNPHPCRTSIYDILY